MHRTSETQAHCSGSANASEKVSVAFSTILTVDTLSMTLTDTLVDYYLMVRLSDQCTQSDSFVICLCFCTPQHSVLSESGSFPHENCGPFSPRSAIWSKVSACWSVIMLCSFSVMWGGEGVQIRLWPRVNACLAVAYYAAWL